MRTLRDELLRHIDTLTKEIELRRGWIKGRDKDREEWAQFVVDGEAKLREIRFCLQSLPPEPAELLGPKEG